MKNSNITLCGEIIHPGEQVSLALPLPELFSCAPLYMPIKVFHGKQPGPCLLITATMHGNEVNGTEIINRLIKSNTLKHLKGTLIVVPVLNVYGLISRSRFLPGGVDLDKCFPGTPSGTHASRMAHLFISEIFNHCNYCIDLQTGFINYTNLPQIYVNFNDEKSKQMAKIFNAPVISNAPYEKGKLQTYAYENNTPYLLYEAGEAMRFDEHAIKVGVKGILNIMRSLQMIASKKTKSGTELGAFFAQKNIWIRASTSGISHTRHKLGQHVKKGESLCTISDPFGATDSENISSPEEGIIVGKNNLPLVHEGEGLLQLAVFSKMDDAAGQLEDWEEQSIETFDNKSNDN